ncbi:HNH endonuclease [Vibrio phage D529]
MILKTIAGYEGIYSIREDGMVRAHDRISPKGFLQKARWFKPCKNREGGYWHVKIQTPDGRKTAYLHRLVAEAFIPNPLNLPQVNHIDGNKDNNHYSNLEWCTQEDNNLHAKDTGLLRHVTTSNRNLFLISKFA